MHRCNITLHFNPTTNIRGDNNSVAHHQDKSHRSGNKTHVDENNDKSQRSHELIRFDREPQLQLRPTLLARTWDNPRPHCPQRPQAKKNVHVNDSKAERQSNRDKRAGSKKRKGDQHGRKYINPIIRTELPQAPAPKNARQQSDQYANKKPQINMPAQPARHQRQTIHGGFSPYNRITGTMPNLGRSGQPDYLRPIIGELHQRVKTVQADKTCDNINKRHLTNNQVAMRQKPRRMCFSCHGEGHVARNCFKRKNTHPTREIRGAHV